MEFTFEAMWKSMGFIAITVMIVLAIMSLFVIYVAIERAYVFFKARFESRAFANQLPSLLENRQYKKAADQARFFKYSHIASIIRSGLLEYIQGDQISKDGESNPDSKPKYEVMGAVHRAIEKASARQLSILRRGLAGLATVGSTAPFVGLFGTVFGIIHSFQGMADKGGGGLGAVAGGIAEALITTGAGIGVAVVAVLLYNYFTNQVDSLSVDTNESALEIVDILIKHSSGSAGSR